MYYKSDKLLIKFVPKLNKYFIKNRIGLDNFVLTDLEFNKIKTVKIKKSVFDMLINEYYRNTEDEWIFEGEKYRKLNNFPEKDWYTKVPKHKKTSTGYFDQKDIFFIVYHLGKIYYCLSNYGGMGRSILYDFKTNEHVKWTSLKNCQPILKVKTNQII